MAQGSTFKGYSQTTALPESKGGDTGKNAKVTLWKGTSNGRYRCGHFWEILSDTATLGPQWLTSLPHAECALREAKPWSRIHHRLGSEAGAGRHPHHFCCRCGSREGCPGPVPRGCSLGLLALSSESYFLFLKKTEFQLSGFLILLPSSQRLRVQKLLFHFIPFSPKPNSFKNLGAAYMLIQNPLHGNKNLTHIMFSF